MANFIQQFNAGGITYDLHDSEFIIDTRTASGAALTGETKAAALFDGMQITFWMNYAAASNATLNLTLADGTTTGAIPCYYSGTTRMGTQYAAGNAIHFTYRENVTIGSTTVAAGWWGDANYSVSDTNYDIFGVSIPIKTRLNAYCLCAMVGSEGTIAKQTNTAGAGTYWQINSFTQSSGTGTSKKLIANQGYYPGKLFYHTGSSAITDASSVSGTISASTSNMDLRYTVNGSTSANIGATGAPFFLVGSLGSDGLFYPNGHASEATKEWWQCGFPTDLTSTYVYWFVGMMSSKYQCRLSDHNWMLKSDGTKWVVFDGAKKVLWDNIEGKPSTFTPASHTHGYISNDGAITDAVATTPASGDKIVVTDASDSNKVKGAITIGSDDGKFLKHDGTWDTLNSGPDTPDAPTTDGNYVLNVNSGSSSWEEAPEGALMVEFNTLQGMYILAETTFTELSDALTSGREVYVKIVADSNTTIGPLKVLSSRYVPQSESGLSVDAYYCSIVYPMGTHYIVSSGSMEHETQATIPIGDAGDGVHVATMIYALMIGTAITYRVNSSTHNVASNLSTAELSSGLLSFNIGSEVHAVEAPFGSTNQYDFIAYMSD